jgi:hypothetical protein
MITRMKSAGIRGYPKWDRLSPAFLYRVGERNDDEPIRSPIGCRQLSGFPGEQADKILSCNG